MRSVGRIWERIRNVPELGRSTAALAVLVAVALSCLGYIFTEYGWQPPWQDPYTVSAEFETVPGVRPESRQEVRIAGVTVGKIESAEPLPNGNARLEMSLEPGHTVYSNARAVLSSKAPINVMYIELDPGGPPGKPLPDGGTIPMSQTERPVQPYEVLNKLDERSRSALTSLINQADAAMADAPEQLPAGLNATRSAMSTFRPVLEQLQARRENIQHLVTSLAQISAAVGADDKRLASLAFSMERSLSVLAHRDKELGATLAQVPGFTQDLKLAMHSTSGLTKQLNPTLDGLHAASDRLPRALSRLSKTVDSAGELVDAARPVVRKAKPLVADLRPFATDVNHALADLAPVTAHLPSATQRIVPWMNDLAAFVYQTSSSFSISDTNGGMGRANFTFDVTNPTGGMAPESGVEPPKEGD